MIDWDLTYNKLGINTLDGYRPKVMCKCDGCGVVRKVTIRVKKRVTDGQMAWECAKCVGNRKEVSGKLRQSTIESWKDDGYKKVQSEKSQRLWSDDKYRELHSKSVNTPEMKALYSLSAKKAWEDSEYRAKHAVALSEFRRGRISAPQKKFYDLLEIVGIDYEPEVVVGPYTYDTRIGDILVEVHGNWPHTQPKQIRLDAAKAEYVKDTKYTLKVIWEYQLMNSEKSIETIKQWFGIGKIDATHVNLHGLSIKRIDRKTILPFMSSFHYIGSAGRCGLDFAAFLGDEIVCAAVFAHQTSPDTARRLGYKHSQVLELTRYCRSPKFYNKNLGSWFLSRVIKLLPEKVKLLVSFADMGYEHDGALYKASGWKYDGDTPPTYFYINDDGWKLHKRTLYRQACGVHMKEAEFAAKFGYDKVMTRGMKRYLYHRS